MNGLEYRFQPGDIAYWHRQVGNDHFVEVSVVDEHFHDAVCLDLLDTKECRYIDGVPIGDVPAVGKWHKLPKGWTYKTELFRLEHRMDPEAAGFQLVPADPESVREALRRGYLVRKRDKFQGNAETEISRDGWRIVLRTRPNVTSTSIRPDRCYTTFAEAKKELDDFEAELRRQSELTDYEWSVELIDKELNRWQKLYGIPEDTKRKYREWLLGMKRVEDIEARLSGGDIQWKYSDNKKWRDIEITDIYEPTGYLKQGEI